jgi:thymidylate synthase (FAD)
MFTESRSQQEKTCGLLQKVLLGKNVVGQETSKPLSECQYTQGKKMTSDMGETKRVVSEGAEKWLNEPVSVLDHGFVYLVDYMGDDLSIEQAARTSYGPGTSATSNSTGLIRYLMRHRHTSPIEMIELKFHVKMPIFIARQWMRHRMASINEMSGRYSILPSEFYIPAAEDICEQSGTNNQGRGERLDDHQSESVIETMLMDSQSAYAHYDEMIRRHNLARETARANLPISIYTEFYWKIDMHNLLHFLNLRLDSHSQLEIRRYAEAIENIVADGWPITHRAFSDYVMNAITFTGPELVALNRLIDDIGINSWDAAAHLGERERKEFCQKIDQVWTRSFGIINS